VVGGAVAVVLLVCVGVGYLALKSVHDRLAAAPGQLPAASSAATHTPSARAQVYRNTVQAAKFQLQIEIEPATTGANVMHLYAFTLAGRPLHVEEWQATASQPVEGADRVDLPMLKLTDNHAVGTISLPARGQWQFQLTLRTSEGEDSVTAQVTIR
jgi:copper transport protein